MTCNMGRAIIDRSAYDGAMGYTNKSKLRKSKSKMVVSFDLSGPDRQGAIHQGRNPT